VNDKPKVFHEGSDAHPSNTCRCLMMERSPRDIAQRTCAPLPWSEMDSRVKSLLASTVRVTGIGKMYMIRDFEFRSDWHWMSFSEECFRQGTVFCSRLYKE
jgi:hypothetical protein